MSSTLLLPPSEQLCNRSCSNKHTPFSSARGSGARVILGSCHQSVCDEPSRDERPKTVTAGAFTKTPTCVSRRRSPSAVLYSVICLRGNDVIRRTQKVIQGDDNGHVGRPCEVSLAPPCPELFCELRGLCRHSYFGPRTCGRSEKPRSSKWRGPNPGFQINPSPP